MSQEPPFGTATESRVSPKLVAILAYIGLLGWIVAIVLNNPKSELASFHLRQALGIHAVSAAAGFLFIVPFLGWIVGTVVMIGAAVFWLIGIINAIEGKMKPAPVLGEQFQEWFHAI